MWIKRITTKHGAIYSKAQLEKEWIKCWESIPQERIQGWVDRIREHILRIIECDCDNLYKEGRKKGQSNKRIRA